MLLHRVVTHLLGIFKGIILYYTVYIAISFSLEVSSIVTGKNRWKTKANGEPKWRQI